MQSSMVPTVNGYDIANNLEIGGFGVVYQAKQTSIDRQVAIKIIKSNLANHPDFIRRFEVEAHVIARLEHPHIVPLYDYWRDPNGAYLVMRYLRGGSLRQLLDRQGSIAPNDVSTILNQISSGLDHAHRNNVIHRDIKPGNILLDEDGNAYIADFGIAKDLTLSDTGMTDADGIVGSLDYLSPEQARSEQVTPRTDIYSLGVTVYEMLVGRHPFHESSSVERLYKHINEPLPEILNLDANIRGAVNDVIQTATQKDPANRYQSVLEFAHAFSESVNATDHLATQLTPREYDVLIRIVDGLSNSQIAEELFIAVSTVKVYVKQIYKKLGVRSRVQATIRAHELNLLNLGVGQDIPTLTGNSYLPEPENPYKGLRPFDAADHLDFFGREALVQKLLNRMSDNDKMFRFLAVVGPSGSGKSSLVRAGLIPALWNGHIAGSDRWYTIDLVPGTHPMDELEIALARIASKPISELNEYLWRDNRGLLRASKLVLPDDDTELVIVIDQFEEVFTLLDDEKERQQFLDIIYSAVTEARSRVHVIVTIRADFYDKPLHYPAFGELMRSRMETILPLSAKELERAIVAPAERQHVVFEEGLVSHIVAEMNYKNGALPLLQYALTELFEHRTGLLLTHAAYQQIGGAVGALAKRAETLFNELDEAHQQITRQMFMRLVTLGEGAGDTRRRANRSELLAIAESSELMDEVIDLFTSNRLLLLDNDLSTREPTVEVAHEAILREWDRLRQWLNESRGDIKQERILARYADDWYHHGRESSYLMHGVRLDEVEQWKAQTEIALTPLEVAFIHESIKQRNADDKAETERQAREAGLERRSRNFLRGLVAVMALGLLIAGALTLFAFDREAEAQRESDVSQSLALAAYAQVNKTTDSFLSLSLVMEAMKVDNPPSIVLQTFYEMSLLPQLTRVSEVPYTIVNMGSLDGKIVYGAHVGQQRKLIIDPLTGVEIKEFEAFPLIQGYATFGLSEFDPEIVEFIQQFSNPGIRTFAANPDTTYFFVGLRDGKASLWDAISLELIREFDNFEATAISHANFSPDGENIAAFLFGEEGSNIVMWNTFTGELLLKIPVNVASVYTVDDLGFTPDGDIVSVESISGNANTLKIMDKTTGEVILEFSAGQETIKAWTISHNGKWLVIYSNTIDIWDIETGDFIRNINDFDTLSGNGGSITFSEDDRLIYGLLATGTFTHLFAFDFGSFNEGDLFAEHDAFIEDIAYSPDGSVITSSDIDGTIYVWDAESGNLIHRLEGHIRAVTDLKFSPDGTKLLSGGQDNTARLWDVATGNELLNLNDHLTAISSIAFSADGKTIMTGIWKEIRFWDAVTGERIHTMKAHDGTISIIDISSDGKTMLTGSSDTTLKLWNLDNYEEIRTFSGHNKNITQAKFSKDEEYIISSSYDGTVRYWNVESGELVTTFAGHAKTITDVDISPDGSKIVSASEDETIKLWSVETGELLHTYDGHDDHVRSVSFSPDGSKILSGSDDKTLREWSSLSLEAHLEWTCKNRVVRDFTEEERERYLIDNETSLCEQLGWSLD